MLATLVNWWPGLGATGGWLLTVVRRKPDSHHFEVLPRRWVVERTLAWLSRCRRLSKDYEERTESSEAWVHIAVVHLMLKRLRPSLNLFVTRPLILQLQNKGRVESRQSRAGEVRRW